MDLPDILTDEQVASLESQGHVSAPDNYPNPSADEYPHEDRGPASDKKPGDLPDVLTDEQIHALELSELPAPSQTPAEELPDVLTDQQVKDLETVDNYSGRQVGEMLKQLGPGEVTVAGAFNTIQAARNYWDRKTGWFDKSLYMLSMPEQMMARQAVNVLENFKGLSTEEAKDLIARDQVHGSDIVNILWKNQFGNPETWGGKAARFTTGLIADILLDPLSYIGIGALTHAGRTAEIAGETIRNLDRMSSFERHYVKTLEKVEQVVTKSGNIESAAGSAEQIAQRNREMVQSALNEKVSFDDLLRPMNLTTEATTEARDIIRAGMTEKSLSRQWWEGERGLTARIGIPFTRAYLEADIPIIGRAIGGVSLGLFDKIGGSMVNVARKMPVVNASVSILKDLSSKTGALLFDEAQKVRLANRNVVKDQVGNFVRDAKVMLAKKKNVIGEDGVGQLIEDITHEMDNGLLTQEEAFKLAKDRGVKVFENQGMDVHQVAGRGFDDLNDIEKMAVKKDIRQKQALGFDDLRDPEVIAREVLSKPEIIQSSKIRINPMVERLYVPDAEDLARAERLAQHPEAVQLIEHMRGEMSRMVKEYEKRGLPMTELNPFGKGWARRYLKHSVTDGFVRKMKEISSAEDAFGEALTLMENTIGGVDYSALGRKYRGTIKAANELALEKLNVKQFVDDPLELFSQRIYEMDKVINDYDLMKAASEYAVVGKNPGIGWVEYNPDHFKKLVLDVSADRAAQWKVFIPDKFKLADPEIGRKVYVPEAVYDKMEFWINGWGVSDKVMPFATAAHFVDRLFRNNALFGTGYLGQNAFSNALTYLMHADYKAPQALANSVELFLPGAEKRLFTIKDFSGAKQTITGEQLLREAVEDSVLKTSIGKEMEFADLAEYVASNREARQNTFWSKAKTLGDVVTLYGLNRRIAEVSDEIPKLAQYIQRRQMGFTRKGAAESAEQLYYNFGIVSKTQDAVRKAIPFSSFAVKTTESVVEQLTRGGLARLTIPAKVNAVFDGAFVQDFDTRKALDEYLPWYKQWGMHPIHGPLMPGQREVLAELPWANATIANLFNPDMNVHPFLQIFGLGLSQKLSTDEFGNMDKSQFWRLAQKAADIYLPPPINNALAIAEITGQADLGGFFKEQYLPVMRANPSDEEDLKLENAANFGKSMADRYGKDWLYKSFFNIPMGEGEEDSRGVATEYAARGEYIRRKFRQMALGTASMTKLDVNYAMNRKAIERQMQMKKDQIASDVAKLGILVDTGRMTEDQAESKIDPIDPREYEVEALQYKLEALDDYYNFILESEEKIRESGDFPGVGTVDIFGYLLGATNYDYSKQGAPHEEDVIDGLSEYDLLTPDKTKKALEKEQQNDH